MIISGSASQDLAAKIAEELNEDLCYVKNKKFADGEKYLCIDDKYLNKDGKLEDEVIIIQSTCYPQDENLMELLFLIKNIKDLGASKIKVVVPYMAYARQEKRFNPGETISAKFVANLIEVSGADEFISVNLHEECVLSFFNIPSKNLSAMPSIADYIKNIEDKPIIVAPDKGAYPFAQEIANILGCECTYLIKVRINDETVETRIADIDNDNITVSFDSVKDKAVFIIDDIIATGGTIVNAIELLKEHGAKSVDVCCVHPILVNGAVSRIYATGARSIISTNTISSDTTRVSLAKTIANELK